MELEERVNDDSGDVENKRKGEKQIV